MRIRTAIMTLFNVIALADGKVTEDEEKMIFDVLSTQFHISEQNLHSEFEKNLKQIQDNAPEMIKEAVFVLREECSAEEVKDVINLLKDLSLTDNNLDRREMMIIEMLEQLLATS
ncbi:hypothetical protein B6D60_08065 [candidate division KSB1 bacterium 4484_87]|nr:MAG: hypothetical protein B6D60_08065 [candidate division KSB1 bacterium 4484_87]